MIEHRPTAPGYAATPGREYGTGLPQAGGPPYGLRGHRPGSGETIFGIDPAASPGDVPWGIRQIVFATLIATAPIVALTLLATLLPADATDDQPVTTFAAYFMVVATILVDGWFVLWAWFYSLRRWRLPSASWGLRSPGARILWLVPTALVAVYAVNMVYEILYQALSGGPTPPQDIIDMFPRSATGVVLFAVMAVVVAPVFEEMVFRGFLFQGLAASYGVVPGVVASAAVFGAIHGQLTVFVPLFILGVALAWVFHATKSLWTSIALHAVFNGISVIAWALTGR